MKILKVTTDNKVSEHEFPSGSMRKSNYMLRSLIGDTCDIYEHVHPNRLYFELGHSCDPYKNSQGVAIGMLVDEEGCCKRLSINPFASWLYRADKHGNYIIGDVLFVGEKMTADGLDFCGIDAEVLEKLKKQVNEFISEWSDIGNGENGRVR